jgi:hypothetical protein
MLLLGDAVENVTDIYTLTADVSQNGSIVLEVPDTTSFYGGFKYQISGGGGILDVKIGDISNNVLIRIYHSDGSNNPIQIYNNDVSIFTSNMLSTYYNIGDVPYDVRVIDGLLMVSINDVIDVSCNVVFEEVQNNILTIKAVTNATQDTMHIVKDVFFDPINVLTDDVYFQRGVYAGKYFNMDYDDIQNRPWIYTNSELQYNGNIGIGTILPLQTETYDLGSTERRWRDLYLSGTTIDLSGTQLSRHTNGNLMIHDVSGTMFGITVDHIDLNGTLITRHTDGSIVVGDGSGNRVTGRFADVTASGNLDVSGNITAANINFTGSLTQNGQAYIGSQWDTSGSFLLYEGNVNIDGDLQCDNLTVNGTTTTINSSTVIVSDPIITLGSPTSDNKDRGIEFKYGSKRGFFGYDSSRDSFIFLKDASNNSEVFSGTSGLLIGDVSGNSTTVTDGVYTTGNQTIGGTKIFSSTITGNISGNSSTATTLQTARTINGVSFNGSANITITANTSNTLTRGSYLTGGDFNGSAAQTWAVDATTAETASKIVARDSSSDIFARLFRSSYANQTTISGALAYRVNNSTDSYIRFCSDAAAIRTFLGISTFNGDTITNNLIINNGSPTVYFQDTDNNSAMLHCNSNLLYVLRGGNNTTSWSQVNGQWPWIWNLTNNDSTCGGSLSAVGNITAPSFYANNWFRSTGQSGWYSESYGGGWYMVDSTYVRVYNNKNIYTAGNIRCDGGNGGNIGYWSVGTMNGNRGGWYVNTSFSGNPTHYFGGYVLVNGDMAVASDRRLKEDIQDVDVSHNISIIQALKPKTFKFIDKLHKGDKLHQGLIAQDVFEVFPDACNPFEEFLPNIGYNPTIISTTDDTSILDICTNTIIKQGDVIRLHIVDISVNPIGQDVNNNTFDDAQEQPVEVNVIGVNGRHVTIDKKLEHDKVYVYGTKTNDCLSVNYNTFIPMLISTNQYLLKQNKLLEDKVTALEEKVNFLLNKF